MRQFSKNTVNTVTISIHHVLPRVALVVACLSLLSSFARPIDPIDELKDPVKSFKGHSPSLMRVNRTGGHNDPPDDKHGGEAMLHALSQSPETWSSDRKSLHRITILRVN